jgi:hypothetical protein
MSLKARMAIVASKIRNSTIVNARDGDFGKRIFIAERFRFCDAENVTGVCRRGNVRLNAHGVPARNFVATELTRWTVGPPPHVGGYRSEKGAKI